MSYSNTPRAKKSTEKMKGPDGDPGSVLAAG